MTYTASDAANTHEFIRREASALLNGLADYVPIISWIVTQNLRRVFYEHDTLTPLPVEEYQTMRTLRIESGSVQMASGYFTTRPSVAWHKREQHRYNMHPVIARAVAIAPPADCAKLVLEWPHVSETDPTRMAYTRSAQHGEADRQTVTSVGKYLRQHFPTLTDHALRDLVATCAPDDFAIVTTMDEMLDAIQQGPTSCMGGQNKDWDREDHPYNVYQPKYGWGMAVRRSTTGIDGRALISNTETHGMLFVRTYARSAGGGTSQRDTALEQWLQAQGYEHASGWDGLRIAKLTASYAEVKAPYIDGDAQYINAYDRDSWVISDIGEYECANQDGTADEAGCTCDECGQRAPQEEMRGVGYYEEGDTCESCISDDYTHVLGRGGNEYYVRNADVVCVGDYCYDSAYLGDNDIVCLEDGDYAEVGDCVAIDDEWYLTDDDRVVCDANGEYQLGENCVYTEDTCDYMLKDDAYHDEASGLYYQHEDNLPTQEEAQLTPVQLRQAELRAELTTELTTA